MEQIKTEILQLLEIKQAAQKLVEALEKEEYDSDLEGIAYSWDYRDKLNNLKEALNTERE